MDTGWQEDNLTLDLHIHSYHSSGASERMTFDTIVQEARRKSIDVIGSGDILCVEWEKEIREKCKTKDGMFLFDSITIIPSVEINCKWVENLKVKQAHILLLLREEDIKETRRVLKDHVNDKKEGRPTVLLSPRELKTTLDKIHNRFIPSHVFTPWFGIMGARCGWTPDEVLEVFPSALETGLSASREMIRTISKLKEIPLVSFSDAHSPEAIGREITIIPQKIEKTFEKLTSFYAVKTHEYPPEAGKYYESGHKRCQKIGRGICEVCGRKIMAGAKEMIERYADQKSTITDTFFYHGKEVTGEMFDPGYDGQYGKIKKDLTNMKTEIQ